MPTPTLNAQLRKNLHVSSNKPFTNSKALLNEVHILEPAIIRSTVGDLQKSMPNGVPSPPDEPPDGGLWAWTQVLMCHLVNFNTFGFITSYGIFQAYYTVSSGYSASAVSWVGTIEIFLTYFVGIFSGRAVDAGYYRVFLAVGLALQLIGTFMTSLSTKYWQLLLAQGFCYGIGNGLLFASAITVAATYFSRKRALAVACVASGGGTGSLVFPSIAETMLHRHGFPWTVRVMGFVMLFNSVLVMIFARTRLPPRPRGPLVDWRAFREPSFALYCLGAFLAFWGLWFAFFYIRSYGLDVLHTSQGTSFNLLLVINGLGIPGRLIPSLLSDRFSGPVNMMIPCAMALGVLMFCWIAVDTIGGLYAWATFYGFFAGGLQSMLLASAASFTADMTQVGARIGIVFAVIGLASLSGPTIGGALIVTSNGSYLTAQIFGGTVMLCGGIVLMIARLVVSGGRLRYRM